jgi:hypothetical protein
MTKLSRPAFRDGIYLLFMLSLCVFAFAGTAETSGVFGGQQPGAQNTNSSGTSTKRRRPLPKPPSGSRDFEKYAGQDSSTRLIAAGATRETNVPRRPLAPIVGGAYDPLPIFKWETAPDSSVYHFAIYEGDLYKNPSTRIVYKTDSIVTELRYPQDAPPLKRGQLYSWRVSTPNPNGKDDDGIVARVMILAGVERNEIRKALARARLISPKTRVDRLAQARVFENYGVWYDALRIARELARDPNDKEALAYYEALLDKLETKPK